MSLPAAPVAVLVLAWDETTPAVRALVEAAEVFEPALDSVVVLVPAGPASPEEVTPEEFLPLAAPLAELLEEVSAVPEAAPQAPLDSPAPEAVATTETGTIAVAAAPVAALPTGPGPVAAVPVATVLPSPTLPAAAPALPAVRMLRLGSFSLPELAAQAAQVLPLPIWQGQWAAPVAPYAGSTAARVEAQRIHPILSVDNEVITKALAATELLGSSPTLASVPASALPLAPPAIRGEVAPPAATYLPAEANELAIDAEQDMAPTLLNEATDLPAAAVAEEPLATEFTSAQGGWPEALASLREPAPLEEAQTLAAPESEAAYYADAAATTTAQALPTPAGLPEELRPTNRQFEAPNLNFQVIQYARFAVPMALAEAPFEAIYAPAWPTWLAAQELRQRTGRPLVLHVASVAAGPGESVETATGWQAELQRQALHRADLILAETPELAYRLRHELHLPAHQVRAVPAADAVAVAQALRTAQPHPTSNLA